MAEAMSYPLLTSADILGSMRELFDQETFSEEDFKSPQAHRIQLAYSLLLENITGADVSRFSQPQFDAMAEITNQEYAEGAVHTLHFALAMQRVMKACAAPDFRITDLLNPKPKKTRRFLSALINFARFRDCRMDNYMAIKEEIERKRQQHAGKMSEINSLKERINQIKAARAEEDARVNQVEAEILEESQRLAVNHRAKEELQKGISQIKTTLSEKNARLEQQKVSILTSHDCLNKLKTQVVQSPERMKADIGRMQAALVSIKQTKVGKTQRLQELQSQAESAGVLTTCSEQGVALAESISQLLGKQKESLEAVEQVRDKVSTQKGAMTDATHREGHFGRLLDNKREKLAKLQLQHQHATAAWQETTERNERDLGEWRKKNEKLFQHIKVFQEEMADLQKEIADKENRHQADMHQLQTSYNSVSQGIDAYHGKLDEEWEAYVPKGGW